jgi:glycosyl transferase family 25
MQIFVINLEKDRERRDSIKRQLDHLQLPFDFFSGVYGKTIPADQLKACYCEAMAMRTRYRKLTASEIGCALSHIGVYREIVKRNIPCALILEDDVTVPSLLRDALDALEKTITAKKPSVILLSAIEGAKARRELGVGNLQISAFTTGYLTHAYVITQFGARALLKALFPVKDVADCWKRLHRHRVVDISVVSPPLVTQNRAQFGSSTTEEIRASFKGRSVADIAVFKCRRWFWWGVDAVAAAYDRFLNPYAGVLKDLKDRDGHK